MLLHEKNYIISPKKTQQKERKNCLLDNTAITRRSASQKRKSRFWQRVKSFIVKMKANKIHGYRFAFLTLTSSKLSGEILHDWTVLKKRIERKYGKVYYFAVRELNKNGDLIHLHIILYSPYIPIRWLSEQWCEIHQASIVFIKALPMKDYKVLAYLAKYVSKTVPLANKRFTRRFTYSLFFPGLSKAWKYFLLTFCKMYQFDILKIINAWEQFLTLNDNWDYTILYNFIKSLG